VATHHGRPGGKILELLLAFGLIVCSIFVLFLPALGFVAAALLVSQSIWFVLPFLFLIYSKWFLKFVLQSHRFVWTVAAGLWAPYLRYYQLEPHTLRSITVKEEQE
jgi:hypothetical protein